MPWYSWGMLNTGLDAWIQQALQEIYGIICILPSYFPVAYDRVADLYILRHNPVY